MTRRTWILAAVVGVIALFAAAFGRSNAWTVFTLFDEGKRIENFRRFGEIFPSRPVHRSGEPFRFERALRPLNFVSALVGTAIADGRIASVDRAVTDYVPELKGSGYDGDRERDLDETLRHRIADRIRDLPGGSRGARLVTELIPLEAQERARVLDESLPAGLVIREG